MNDNNNTQPPDRVQPGTPTTGSQPAGKETEPIAQKESFVKELGTDHEIPVEVQKAGVSKKKDKITLPDEVERAGVKPVGTDVPIPREPVVKLPISDEQIEKGLHNNNPNSSFSNLAKWCIRQLHKVHLSIKKIHGRVVRTRY